MYRAVPKCTTAWRRVCVAGLFFVVVLAGFGEPALAHPEDEICPPGLTPAECDGLLGTLTPPPVVPLGEVLVHYVRLGFVHIVPKGVDHILFVLCLFFSTTRLKTLLWQVTAFTLAHSVTLALAVFELIFVPAAVVEPLIAASIAAVAIENFFRRSPAGWRLPVVFVFGLLHGLGFAGALTELGLPAGDFAAALVAFNVGVEVGQITVLLSTWLLLRGLFAKPIYRPRVVLPASAAIAAVALYWTVERILL